MTFENVDPDYTPINLNDPVIAKILEDFKTKNKIIKISKVENPLPIGNCYWNVNSAVKKMGGHVIYGWDISCWAGSHITAMHHAVWDSPEQGILDITETYTSKSPRPYSTFLADDSIKIDLERPPLVPSVYYCSSLPETNLYVSLCQALHKLQKRHADLLYNAGYRCEIQQAKAAGLEPPEYLDLNINPDDQLTLLNIGSEILEIQRKLGTAINALKLSLSQASSQT